MSIKVKFFARMRDEAGQSHGEVQFVEGISTADLWSQIQSKLPPEVLPIFQQQVVGALDEVPIAPLRGEMACFISDPAVMDVVRSSCRRSGLDLRRHGVSEAPNPTAHKRGLVLLDVPLGQDRRFDWCKRLKHQNPDVRVILLVHHPSKARVLRGLIARADVILGWPLDEPVLCERLNNLIEPSDQ